MNHTERTGRPSPPTLAGAAGVAAAVLVALLATASALGSAGPNITALSASAGIATETVTAQLRAECLDWVQAIALLSAELKKTGDSSGFTVRADGPLAYPIGEGEAVRGHLANGCYVYSGMGNDANGDRVFYISGPDAIAAKTPAGK